MDLLIVTDNNLETIGGEQESTKIIIEGVKNKFNVGVIQPGSLKKHFKEVNYFELTRHKSLKELIKKPFSFASYINNIRKIINKEKPKIVHTQAQASFFIISFLMKFNLVTSNFRFLHTERGLYKKYNLFFKFLFIIFINKLDILITTTEFNMNSWKKVVKSLNINIDFKIIENTAGKAFEYLDESLVENEELTIGFAGRYREWKNWPLAVDIVKKLSTKIDKKFSIKIAVGCSNKKEIKKSNEMFNKIKKLKNVNLNKNVNLTFKQMEKFYYDIDIFILTSKPDTESFGRTLVEAMSRKTEVLTTKSGGSVEVVGSKSKVCSTSEEFVEKILFLDKNQDLLEKEKERNLSRVKNKYSLKNNIKKHLNLYNNIIKRKEGELID